METAFANDLHVLANALRYGGFRFILIGHNRSSLYVDITGQLRTTFADRPFLELRLRDKTYRQITDEILSLPNGIVLIPDFDWLIQPGNETVRIAFNQRRDAFARLDSAFICFIEPGSWRSIAEKLPDWWSLRSLELDFHRETSDTDLAFAPSREDTSSLGGETKAEKEAEIERLMRQLDDVEPANKTLILSLTNQIGTLWFELSNYETALTYLEQSLSITRQISDKKGEGATLNNISQIYQAQGDYETALTYLEQSLSIQQQIRDKSGEGATLNNISQIYDARGDYETALTYLEQSLSIQQQLSDRTGEDVILNNIGLIYKAQGYYEEALGYFQQSLRIKQQTGNISGEAVSLNNIGQIYRAQGNYEKALSILTQGLIIQQQLGMRSVEATSLNNIGLIHQAQGDFKTSLIFLQRSLTIRQEIGDRNGVAMTMHNMGAIYFGPLEDLEKALTLFWPAYALFRQLRSSKAEVTAKFLADIKEQIGEARFQAITQSIPNPSKP